MKYKEIEIAGGALATYSEGQGDPILFIHGGPGDTHHYLREVAKRFSSAHQVILYDQRGTGRSFLSQKTSTSVSLNEFQSDINSIFKAYDLKRFSIFGHSWGAMLSIYYALNSHHLIDKLILVGTGPLDDHFNTLSSQLLRASMTEKQRVTFEALRTERNHALEKNNHALVMKLDNQMMYLRAASMVFKPELREGFLNNYFADPPVDRVVNRLIWETLPKTFNWEALKSVAIDTLIIQGENDYLPAEQVKLLNQYLPASTILLVKECAHIPWIDQPELFYHETENFLGSKKEHIG